MVASGLPARNGERHVEEIAKLSLDLLKTIGEMTIPHLKEETLRLRIGFNTGWLIFECSDFVKVMLISSNDIAKY